MVTFFSKILPIFADRMKFFISTIFRFVDLVLGSAVHWGSSHPTPPNISSKVQVNFNIKIFIHIFMYNLTVSCGTCIHVLRLNWIPNRKCLDKIIVCLLLCIGYVNATKSRRNGVFCFANRITNRVKVFNKLSVSNVSTSRNYFYS